MALRFWAFVGRWSYWLYERGLPSGYGRISHRYALAALRRQRKSVGTEDA
jgi:hypothetical protein